jgi:hypothetical protein
MTARCSYPAEPTPGTDRQWASTLPRPFLASCRAHHHRVEPDSSNGLPIHPVDVTVTSAGGYLGRVKRSKAWWLSLAVVAQGLLLL